MILKCKHGFTKYLLPKSSLFSGIYKLNRLKTRLKIKYQDNSASSRF